jgi:hypothetical protein
MARERNVTHFMLRAGSGKRRLRVYSMGRTMSETEKKGSAWPWIAVPLAAVVTFFLLRECQHRLPASHPANASAPVPAASSEPANAATPAPEPAPQ